jgi:hypothetical protein
METKTTLKAFFLLCWRFQYISLMNNVDLLDYGLVNLIVKSIHTLCKPTRTRFTSENKLDVHRVVAKN